ncbi:WD40-repeat-containing domain protein [Schizothecium vesticola]|uniref:WD40-repeat-containing domain protein n=1 Tax=Schizothecium vesticola TaxID=314040 RepID=A0AA40EL20_9PEZI|nr:WD40-repeat-containing domain protein [Schizothecium vesticola]
MNTNLLLFERSLGNLRHDAFAGLQTEKLLKSFRSTFRVRFDGGERVAQPSARAGTSSRALVTYPSPSVGAEDDERHSIWAHQAGVTALAVERFEGRRLVSGGADGIIKLWDLEQCPNPNSLHTYRPVLSVPRAAANSTAGHRFSVTHLSFYPFDELAFLSSSFDQTLKLWSTASARVSGSFDLGAKVYTHATSPIAPHLLVACATQHAAVRLVDLRSSAAIQSLLSPGQTGSSSGAVLSVAWSPIHEHVLASGSVDGAVRIWDIRRSNALVGLLDQEDSLGILHPGRMPAPDASTPATPNVIGRGIRMSAKAHTGPVNGLAWTDSGTHLVSAGHDRRVRVWDAATGANTLANFGPTLRNAHVGSLTMFAVPEGLAATRRDLLFYPNEGEILVMDLHEGTIVTRLRGAGPTVAAVAAQRGERAVRNRVSSIAWRGAGGSGSHTGGVMGGRNTPGAIYSGHMDGQIRAWMPQLEGLDDEAADEEEDGAREKKRKALDDAFRSLMGRRP